jgi:hypothetical protein
MSGKRLTLMVGRPFEVRLWRPPSLPSGRLAGTMGNVAYVELGEGDAVARLDERAPNSFQRWVVAHARVLYAVGAVVLADCVWRLVGALRSPGTRDVLGAALNTLTWLLLTLQVRLIVRHVVRYDRRASASGLGSSTRRERS